MEGVLDAQGLDIIRQHLNEVQNIVNQVPIANNEGRAQLELQLIQAITGINQRVQELNWRQRILTRAEAVQNIVAALNNGPVEEPPINDLHELAVEVAQQLPVVAAQINGGGRQGRPAGNQAGLVEEVNGEDVGDEPIIPDWLFAEVVAVEVGTDPIEHVDVAVGEDDNTKVADQYRSNKGNPMDRLDEGIRDRPYFREDGREMEFHRHQWFVGVRETRVRPDVDLVEYLKVEAMFLPRTPGLALVLKDKAKRWLERFDTSGVTREDAARMIGEAVTAAYMPTQQEIKFHAVVNNWRNKATIIQHNQCFGTGQSNVLGVPGQCPKSKVSVAKVLLYLSLILGTVSLVSLASLMRRRLLSSILMVRSMLIG